jgi:hypothetical protein
MNYRRQQKRTSTAIKAAINRDETVAAIVFALGLSFHDRRPQRNDRHKSWPSPISTSPRSIEAAVHDVRPICSP